MIWKWLDRKHLSTSLSIDCTGLADFCSRHVGTEQQTPARSGATTGQHFSLIDTQPDDQEGTFPVRSATLLYNPTLTYWQLTANSKQLQYLPELCTITENCQCTYQCEYRVSLVASNLTTQEERPHVCKVFSARLHQYDDWIQVADPMNCGACVTCLVHCAE